MVTGTIGADWPTIDIKTLAQPVGAEETLSLLAGGSARGSHGVRILFGPHSVSLGEAGLWT